MRQETSYLKETLRQSLLCTGDSFFFFYNFMTEILASLDYVDVG